MLGQVVYCIQMAGIFFLATLISRETREGGGVAPADCMLKRGKWGLKEYLRKGSFLDWFVGSSCRYKRFLFCLGCFSRPRTKYFFPHRKLICPHRPACRFACLLICVSAYTIPKMFLQWNPGSCPVLPQPESMILASSNNLEWRIIISRFFNLSKIEWDSTMRFHSPPPRQLTKQNTTDWVHPVYSVVLL
jgi:hypothetical protein